MPRPERIQYENAFYHVMNRGRGRQSIFHGEEYYFLFKQAMEEASVRFGAIFHSYCLMDNHLLIETPRANLDRIMRHINGVYTQRYNRLKKTDGTLFRGRYKAVLVDKDAYLLQLSRYIHRNPAEVKGAPADIMSVYPWSSYLAYINKAKVEPWLERDKTYQMLGQNQKYAGYRRFVEAGVDEDIQQFYNKGNTAAVLGDIEFKEYLSENKDKMKVLGELSRALSTRYKPEMVVKAVAKVYGLPASLILKRKTGRQSANLPRKFAMYCCQHLSDMSLKSIALMFGLTSESSVSPAVHSVRKKISAGELDDRLESVKNVLKNMQ